ncbi:PKD domain-containing protein [Flavobacteriales bacterium]|nr:PKD domain-containing protein [Flavobacteriales bacterium]
MIRLKIISFALLGSLLLPQTILAQCATVLGSDGIATNNPSWYSCSGSNELQIETSSAWTDLVVDWGDGSSTESIGTFIVDDVPLTHVYDGSADNYTVVLSEANGSCEIVGHFNIGMPESNFTSSNTLICQGNSIQFSQGAVGVDYTWNFGANDIFLPTGAGNVSFTFQNPGNYEVQSVISIPGSDATCTDTTSIMVEVLENPVIQTSFTATEGCGDVTFSAEVSAANSYIYVWTYNTDQPMFYSGTNLESVTFDAVGNHPVAVAVTGWNGCQTSAQEIITVHPEPIADFTYDAVCQGEPTVFVDQSTAHATSNITGWQWTFGDGNESYESSPSNGYAFTGDYNVSLVVTTPECTASTSQLVSVHPNPTVGITSSVDTGCSPLEVTLSADGVFANTFDWNLGTAMASGEEIAHVLTTALDENPMHEIAVTATSNEGCTATESIAIEALPSAIAQFTLAAAAGCAPFTPVITNASLGAINYEWWLDGALASSSSNWNTALENSGDFIANAEIELIALAANGCHDSNAQVAEVYPQADFSFALPTDSVCSPLEFTLPVVNGSVNHEWNLGNGATTTAEAPNVFYQNTGTGLMGVSITYAGTSPFGCTDMHTETVYIRPQPVASFTSDEVDGCEPLAANFENTTTNADSYIWDFGNGITDDGETASYAFSTSGEVTNFQVTLTAMDDLGCSDVATHTVTVYPAADFALDLTSAPTCAPVELTLPSFDGLYNFDWNFGDGTTSTENGPTHVWENETDAAVASIITLEAETEFGCGGMAVALLQVKPSPTADFSTDIDSGCEPLAVNFMSESNLADSFSWDFGNGQTAATENATEQFTTNGENTEFDITFTVTHALGCTDTATKAVTVFPAAVVDLNFGIDSVCSPLTLTMPAFDGVENITWDFGDGNTSNEATPSHTWENNTGELMAATVTFSAQTENGCTGTTSTEVFIKPQPVAEFSTDFDNGCEPLVSQFGNNSSNADAFDWNFGNGDASNEINPSMVFFAGDASETFTVTLTATDDLGCADTATKEVTVHPGADFALDLGNDSVCSPLSIDLPAIANALNITWDFGDGNTSNEATPSHTWENNTGELMAATVTFSAQTENGCTGTTSTEVFIKPQPVAAFTASEVSGCEPLLTTFDNASTNGDAYIWNFGDVLLPGEFNMAPTVDHEFNAAGNDATTFTVTLLAIDNLGCTDERTLDIEVLPTPEFNLVLAETEACSPLVLTMPEMNNATTGFWSFGDGTLSNESTPTHSWSNSDMDLATFSIEYQGSNAFGCTGTASADVDVKPQPIAAFSTPDAEGCAPHEASFINMSERADSFILDFGNGNDESNNGFASVLHSFEGAESTVDYTVSLTAMHALGCSDVHEEVITVFPAVVSAWMGATEGCAPLDATFALESNDNVSAVWNLNGNTFVGDSLNATLDGITGADAQHTIGLAVTSAFGCQDSTEIMVTVHPVPVLSLSTSSAASCSDEEWIIFNDAQFADSTAIVFDNGTLMTNPADSIIISLANENAEDLVIELTQLAFTDFGCSAASGLAHIVHPNVTAAFDAPEAACTPLEVNFTSNSVNASGSTAWTFGDGTSSVENNPMHVFATESTNDSTFTVSLLATNAAGCADSTSAEVIVFGRPVAEIALDSLEGCYPVNATFANNSVGNTSVSWNYGNGEFSAISDSLHTKTFFNPTETLITYTTILSVSNEHNCEASSSVAFDVAPHLNAQFDMIGQGCSPVDGQLINQSEGAASFIWNFGDGSASSNETNPEHVFVNTTNEDQTFQVELIALSAYGCVDTVTVGVEVYPMPAAQFSVTPAIQTYPNTTVGINNNSLASASAVQYWSFGDGDEVVGDQPVFHTFDSWGTYNITLLVDNGICADAHTEQINILSPHPVASFVGSGSGCAPLMVAFENNSNHGAGYVWNFDNDQMTSEESPVHVFTRPGTYNVSLTVIGFEGQEEEVIHYGAVEVFPSATAAFVNSPTEVIVPDQPVEFVNLSDDASVEFLWNFGDGQVSTEVDPIHFYTEPGIYDVTLTANNAFNCPTSYTLEHAVEATTGGFMEFPTAFTPINGGGNGGGYDPAALDNDIFHPHHTGIVDYELIIFNKWGELIFRSTDVYVGWDGYYQGILARQDVYAWKATAQFSNGHRVTKAGDVTLIVQ